MVIRLASISDIHQGCNRVAPNFITTNLRKHLFPQLNDDLDILEICGDFFDNLLDLGSVSAYEALCILIEIVDLAKKHNFLIRVTQGTFTHDRHQTRLFNLIDAGVNKHGEQIVKVYSVLDIEFIESLGISVMYIPDDLPYTNVMEVIDEAFKAAGITQVDFIINHGFFEHLIPAGMAHKPSGTLNIDVLKKRFKGCVFNGHVHTPSVYKKCVNNGSFDRLCHGEEEAKGFFMVEYDTYSNHIEHEFIENTSAAIFKTINLCEFADNKSDALDYAIPIVTDLVKQRPNERVNIGIVSPHALVNQSVMQYLNANFDTVRATRLKNKASTMIVEEAVVEKPQELPCITQDNFVEMACDFASTLGYDITPEYIKSVLDV